MMKKTVITNGTIVTATETFPGHILISNGKIEEIEKADNTSSYLYADSEKYEMINAEGHFVIPGLIDLHSDAFEKIINPRKNALFPFSFSFRSMQPQLLSCGITTILHAVSFNGEEGLRSNENGLKIAEEIETLRNGRDASLRHLLHIRYELINEDGIDIIKDLIHRNWVQLLSMMDHSSQYDSKYQLDKTLHLSEEEVKKLADDSRSKRNAINPEKWNQLIQLALKHGIPVASHDDESKEQVEQIRKQGLTISEFPLTEEAASHAVHHNLYSVFGAPNILRGQSHKNSISAKFAVRNRLANIICSDYYPYSLLQAIFILHEEGMELHEAVSLATLHPAKALKLDKEIGSLEPGKNADLLLVDASNKGHATVTNVMVNGQWNFVQRGGNVANTYERV